MPLKTRIDDVVHRVKDGETATFEVVVRQFERPLRAWRAGQTTERSASTAG